MKILTTLALLKTSIDHSNSSLLDGYTPFIRYCLVKIGSASVDESNIKALMLDEFGFSIPTASLKLMLEKMCKNGELSKLNKKYIIGPIKFDFPGFESQRFLTTAAIDSIVSDFITYCKNELNYELATSDAEMAILVFMDNNTIECVNAFVHHKEISLEEKAEQHYKYAVASFIEKLRKTNAPQFNKFVVLLIGRLSANLLNGATVIDSSEKLKGQSVYLDTPFLIKLIGFAGKEQQNVALELVKMARSLGATIKTFLHLRDELDNILSNVEKYLDGNKAPINGSNNVYLFFKEQRKTKSDVILFRSQLDEKLKEHAIAIEYSPHILPAFNISDSDICAAMEEVGLNYNNKDSKQTDIETIRAIYQLRAGKNPRRLEQANAILCTTNGGLSRPRLNMARNMRTITKSRP